MIKLVVLICYLSGIPCEWLPWTNNPNDPHLGKPIAFGSQAECEARGQFQVQHHGGRNPPFAALAYYITDFKCEPE